jgi:hypothetical protein
MENPLRLSTTSDRVLCRATVDKVDENQWLVEVFGLEPHDYVRRYEIAAKSDTLAAQEGIRRFVAEMEARREV